MPGSSGRTAVPGSSGRTAVPGSSGRTTVPGASGRTAVPGASCHRAVPVPQGIVRGGIQEIEFGAPPGTKFDFGLFWRASCRRVSGVAGFRKSNLVPPRHQIRFRIVLACQLPQGTVRGGIQEIEFGAPRAPNSISDCLGVPVAAGYHTWWDSRNRIWCPPGTKFDFGLFWRASCQRTAASWDCLAAKT